jgi:hypothetical protein
MFTEIYSWCTTLGEKLLNGTEENPDFVDYYNAYFADTPVCSTIFWTALAIAVVVGALYYFGVCNYVFKLAKRWVWFCVLALVFIVTFFTTMQLIVGHDADEPEESTGIFFTAHEKEAVLFEDANNAGSDKTMIEKIESTASDFREQFKAKEDSIIMYETLPYEMSLVNAIFAMIFFFVFSIFVKRFTTHGAAVPF